MMMEESTDEQLVAEKVSTTAEMLELPMAD
jgi:hypothetical protein